MMEKVILLPNVEVNPENPNPQENNVTRDIHFIINDGTDAIQGATVNIGEITGTTGSAGGCTLHNISDGEHSVTISAEGYITKTETITVSESDTTFTITLQSE